MAIRKIVTLGDDILFKKSRPVEKIDQRIITLLDDMIDTLAATNGAGLAAPQVGVLRRIAVVDAGEGPIELINPEIISKRGAQRGPEGCLSYPGKYGIVVRPNIVTVRAMDRHGKIREITGEGFLARAICHETDHLDGKMYMELVIEWHNTDNNGSNGNNRNNRNNGRK